MREWKVVRATVLVVACGYLTAPVARAQVLYGSIVGNVQDSSGAALPGATVTITSRETNLTRSTVTNEVGGYTFANVLAGTYDEGVPEGVQGVREDRGAGDREHGQPRGHGPRHRSTERDPDRAVGNGAAADRQGRHAHRAPVGGHHPAAAPAEPQLPVAHQPGARRDAGADAEQRGGHTGSRAEHERERARQQQQRHPHGRRTEPEHLSAAPHDVRLPGRDDRYG